MAKQPTPAFRLYEQGSAPRPNAAPLANRQDVSSGLNSIGQSLARAGAAVENFQETNLQIERLQQARREDDARIDVTRRMAEFRRDANQALRTTFEEAPDGWRDGTTSYSQRFNALRDQRLADESLTPEARAMFEDQLSVFEQSALDTAADREYEARGQWQIDATRQAVDAGGSVLVTDPDQYEAVRLDALETLGAISDPNARRDSIEIMEESYARYAVGGLIEANPRAALTALQNPEAEGAYARLSPAARAQAMGQAQAEIDRRHARWVASVNQSVQAAERMFELGIPTDNAPSVETVRSALGNERALAYEASREMSSQFGTIANSTSAELAAIVADTNPRTNERDAVLQEARRRAAAATLQQRQEDPMQYQVRHGLTEPADLVAAVNEQDWSLVNQIMRTRASAAQTNGERMGMAPLPLTAFEANVLGARVRSMSAQERGAFLRNAAAWMGRDSQAFAGLNAQLFPNNPGSAFAGYISGVNGERGAADADVILRGEDILGGRSAEGESSGGRSRLVDMPEEDDMRRQFRRYVGDAYAGMQTDQQGNRVAEAQAYEVYRAAYAGLIERSPQSSNAINTRLAQEAARMATGGVVDWNGRRTLMPPGMSQTQFQQQVRQGFLRWNQFQNVDPRDYTLLPLGPSPSGRGFRYGVFDGEDPVRDPSGRPVEIEVRRR